MCTLYERIIELCKAKGVSGSRMCLDLKLSKSTLSDIKSGRKKGVSTATAQKIASYFGVSVEYLLSGNGVVEFNLTQGLGGLSAPCSEAEETPTDSDSDILDEVDVAFYGDYKELDEDDKETLRAMARVMRERRAKRNQEK